MKSREDIKAGLCFNLKKENGSSDNDEEYDEPCTIDFLAQQLGSFGFEVARYEQDESVFDRLREDRPQWVMNITEGKGKFRSRESQLPVLLEWLDIPYYGSDPIALGITLDKALTSKFLRQADVPVPSMFLVNHEKELDMIEPQFIHPRYIVKPRWEGSSKGILQTSVVSNHQDCRKQAQLILKQYGQPAIVEEYIAGDEITVAVMGNEDPEILGMMKISAKTPASEGFVYSLEHKRDWRQTIRYEAADKTLSRSLIKELEKKAVAAFKCLELRDIARIDFRIDEQGIPRIIDVNPLPGLSPEYSDLMLMSQLKGADFPEIVQKIIRVSLKRCNILEPVHE